MEATAVSAGSIPEVEARMHGPTAVSAGMGMLFLCLPSQEFRAARTAAA
eukprot:CAMPEP_0114042278 /NCGR_PEP_ID=MMETSP1339-20121228/5595_1 /TAXON_ID=94617 /ORGANISM="Fibrocapsa japonica" /LENGTH=48 /assembly_acc=CAM_ASM_000762